MLCPLYFQAYLLQTGLTMYDVRVRSYMPRASRITPAQRQAYEKLLPVWTAGNGMLDWDALFPGAGRNVVEIGFGMGEATVQAAAEHPDWGIVGIEVYPPGVGKLLLRMEQENIANIRFVVRDAVDVFRDMIPPASVDAVHIWFPDPWPKKRHHKRRLIRSEFMALLIPALRDNGIIHVATDWAPYAEHILAVLEGEETLRNRYSRWAPGPENRPPTKFEIRGRQAGRVIRDIVFEKKSSKGDTL